MRSSLLLFSVFVAACGSDDVDIPPGGSAYGTAPGATVVIGVDGARATTAPADAKACAADERRDVIVDSAGKVVATLCYPTSDSPAELESTGNVTIDRTAGKAVLALDDRDDGVDVTGNVEVASNNAVIYGQGPSVSIIGGNVDARGNNFSARGLTVKGNVEVDGNNATLALCVIEGNVKLEGNNNVIADCTIRGNVEIDGNNNVFVRNRVAGNIDIEDGRNAVCDGNLVWSDANNNRIFDAGETSGALACAR